MSRKGAKEQRGKGAKGQRGKGAKGQRGKGQKVNKDKDPKGRVRRVPALLLEEVREGWLSWRAPRPKVAKER